MPKRAHKADHRQRHPVVGVGDHGNERESQFFFAL
jgi:hypothetical protein